jgi:sporulation protein YunB
MVRSFRDGRKEKGKRRMVWLFLAACLCLFASLWGRLHFLALEYGEDMIQYTVTKEINQAISQKILANPTDFQELVKLERDDQNRITALTTDTIAVNRVKMELQQTVYEGIGQLQSKALSIPLGNLAPTDLLTGRGPNIPMRMSGLGYIQARIASAFTQAGINQTRHSLIVEITADFHLLTPLGKKPVQVKNSYHLSDAILVGSVPESYVYIDQLNTPVLGKIPDNS